ncbi:hypothetical protein [Hafnia phage Pocis76]|uniref:Uncharacterized protein n=1 Tax=Hafnia phage Pocis76 TaxID=2831174 RepID=A0A8E7KYW0_9CAUD|nr:hypothetical protein [Hafnia phage Pocis76]
MNSVEFQFICDTKGKVNHGKMEVPNSVPDFHVAEFVEIMLRRSCMFEVVKGVKVINPESEDS